MLITISINGKLKTFNSPAKNFVEAMELIKDMKGGRDDVEVISIEQPVTKKQMFRATGMLPKDKDNE